jgi:hypothetical protein
LLTAYYGSDPAWKWQLIGSSNTDESVTLSKPRHIDITADRAYVVVPATYSYKEKGTLVKEPGSIWTLALKKDEAGWRITGWAWTAP